MNEKKNEIILFENQGVRQEVNLKDETVWLTQEQMSKLFLDSMVKAGKLKDLHKNKCQNCLQKLNLLLMNI